MVKLDDIDRKILRELQKDGRISNLELSEKVGLSPSPCLRRVRMLEDTGLIERYVAVVNPARVGLGLTVFARVSLISQDAASTDHFARCVMSLPEVIECHLMAGECDFLLRIVTRDLDAYRAFQVEHLTRIEGVRSVKTDIPMQRIKLTSELPV
ncbi:AsnC family transcriptional regulator [Acuticoccus sediminis]|uniref:AsnC family transcriptional regulator n=1 Tax=Acuticoccus sediminis TaxID=2184697 RepID=A0A8B2NXF3_9HYPH|nr:Lrp/AsnC family transcriptional regulator [Acuticoccus sediminis]RAI02214.1 AsnC family transcriptional regulator [Acuticoccus sediminis]